MNLSNKLTLTRVVLIPVFLLAILPGSFGLPELVNPVFRTLALLIFIAAAVTDYYDGVLARRHGWISDFGKIIDPLADKLIIMAAFVAMVELDLFPAWMVVLILCREFLITGLRTLAIIRGRVLAADRWGKNKTISQMTVIITALVVLAAHDILDAAGLWQPYFVDQWDLARWLWMLLKLMLAFALALTLYSGWNYIRKNWDLIRESIE